MSTTNIDDLLLGGQGNSQQPQTPEVHDQEEAQPLQDVEETSPDYDDAVEPDKDQEETSEESDKLDKDSDKPKKKSEVDEYGNEKEPENEAIRERLARQARKHEAELNELRQQLESRGASQEVQQAAKDFEYDPEEGGDWQQQLASFVKQTVNSMSKEQESARQQQEEARVQQAFESKFREGMQRFDDFREVISDLPCEITNPMTLATRSMDNPAAFLYAAAKRHPQELERISKLRDPYAQMTEIGKLEERMRRNKPTTKAPRPLGRSPEDSTTPQPKKKTESHDGDALLAAADAKRLATVKNRLRGNR